MSFFHSLLHSSYMISKQRDEDARLNELKKQLEIATTRCNTLQKQLDYIRNLYYSKHLDCSSKYKINHSRRKGKNKNKSKEINGKPTLKKKISNLSLEKSNTKLAGNTSKCKKKSSHKQINNLLPNDTDCEILPFLKNTEQKANIYSNRNTGVQSRLISLKAPSVNSKPYSHHLSPASMPLIQEIPEILSHVEDEDSKPTQVMQDIIRSMSNKLNRIAEINYIIDHERKCYSDHSRDEDYSSTSISLYKNEMQQTVKPKLQEVKEVYIQTSEDHNTAFNCTYSENSIRNIYEANPKTTKKKNFRSSKLKAPLNSLATPHFTESIESIHGKKRKNKLHEKLLEKKSKSTGSSCLNTKEQSFHEEEQNSELESVRVIQDMVYGMANKVNDIFGINYINDQERKSYSDNSGEEDSSSTLNNKELAPNIKPKLQKVKENGFQISDDLKSPFNSICSENNTGHIYETTPKTTKKSKSRYSEHNAPLKLLESPYITETIHSVHEGNRKSKLRAALEKKSKDIGSSHLHENKFSTIPDKAISVTKKIKKRAPKSQNCTSKSSSQCKSVHRDAPYKNNLMFHETKNFQNCETTIPYNDITEELYCSLSSLYAEASSADVDISRHLSKLLEYPQKQFYNCGEISNIKLQDENKNDDNGYNILDESSDVITNRINEFTTERKLESVFGNPNIAQNNFSLSEKVGNNAIIPLGKHNYKSKSRKKSYQLPTISSKLKKRII